MDEYLLDHKPVVRHPFLRRLVRKRNRALGDVLRGAIIQNGLESKVCLNTYKVHYVEETEDIFARVNRKRKDSSHLKKKYEEDATRFRKKLRLTNGGESQAQKREQAF
jgi:histone deacetylase complex regulatory component SIN3